MRTRAPLLVAATLLATAASVAAQNPDAPTPIQLANTPPALLARLTAAHILDDHTIDYTTSNPFYLRADLDGDRKPDYIVALLRKQPGEDQEAERMLVLFGNRRDLWLDPRDDFGIPGHDAWHVQDPKRPLRDDPTGDAPRHKYEAIYLDAERSSGLLYWTGKRFEMYWTHD
jgi:hypothetical protein